MGGSDEVFIQNLASSTSSESKAAFCLRESALEPSERA